MDNKKLQEILERHCLWLKSMGGARANLCGADLRGADLRGANLYGANLYEADLRGAYLYGANLYEADLRGAYLYESNLYGADLRGANLCEADLRGANLCGADLRGADLRGAYLYGANLYEADLRGANLCGADLRGADLRVANLYGANLYGANLYGANLYEANLYGTFAMLQCPEIGSFTAFKKLKNGYVATLIIPSHAKRSSATTRKCRASEAYVVSIDDGAGNLIESCESERGGLYEVGKTTFPDSFDDNRWNECSNGIHFFITRKEAEEY